ncbi:MAG: DNA recombination protein RmuC [Bacteroidia bacterium]
MSVLLAYVILAGVIGLLIGAVGIYVWLSPAKKLEASARSLLQAESDARTATHLAEQAHTERDQIRKQYEGREEQVLALTRDLTKMAADYDNLASRMAERSREVEGLQERFKADFAVLANKIMQRNSAEFSQQHRTQLDGLLEPLKERLTAFEKQVQESYQQESRERFHLKKEIEQLVSLNHQMGLEARNLTKALKGDNKTQGNWGEMVLGRVLENSGLRKGEEYETQASFVNEEGARRQPDVLVRLPEDRHIVVDSKVSLKSYEALVSEEDEQVRQQHLVAHTQSVVQHIKGLSSKHYAELKGLRSPDFVLLFMPIEAAFSLAVQASPELFQQAWEQRIIVVSPTTLLATLRTVSSIWKLERQNRNAEEIARQGGLLYDKFVGFVEEMDKTGKHIDQASRSHENAMRKLRDGRGALTTRAEKLRELGVRNAKNLPETKGTSED